MKTKRFNRAFEYFMWFSSLDGRDQRCGDDYIVNIVPTEEWNTKGLASR